VKLQENSRAGQQAQSKINTTVEYFSARHGHRGAEDSDSSKHVKRNFTLHGKVAENFVVSLKGHCVAVSFFE
jgi:hypothetical protein